MKYKNIEIGKWYYVQRWPLGTPEDMYIMKAVQKCEKKQIILTNDIVVVPFLTKAKYIIAEATKEKDNV